MFRKSNRCQKRNIGVAVVLSVILLLAMTVDVSSQYQVRKPGAAKTQASIQVTSPTSGATWEKGKRYDITWTSSGIRGGSVKIDLIDGNGKAISLVRQTINNGKYSFSLKPNVSDGDYRVRVSTTDGKTTGESSGTVHVGKTFDSAVKTTFPTTSDGIQSKTYTPRTSTTTEPKSTTPTTSTTQPVNVAEHSTVASPDVVRHDFPAVQVPITEVQMFDLPTIASTSTIQPRSPQMKLLPSMIDVTSPVADVAWQAGEQYTINWTSHDLDGPVKIDLIKAQRGTDGVVSHYNIPVVASTENDGTYEYLVPERMGFHSTYFTCEVSSLDGQTTDQSPAYFDVYTEPIDMTCKVVDLSQKWEKDNYPFVYYRNEEWLEFNVWLRNNGTHRQIDNVMVSVILIKEPEELVVAQEEWGLSSINAQLWYSTPEPRKFNIYRYEVYIGSSDREADFEYGAYRIEIEVDPENRLGENPDLRDNNKFVCRFEIRSIRE